jgi:hypothetical protein
MKKRLVILFLVLLLCISSSSTFCANEQAELASFPVTFNGVIIDNQHATYPLLVYKGITYFPMTWDFSSTFGLTTTYSETKGLEIRKNGSPTEVVQNLTANNDFNKSYTVELPYFPVTVNGRLINNAEEPYPILHFRNITYFPLTWAFAVTEFGWDYTYSDAEGLKISATSSTSAVDNKTHYTDKVVMDNGDVYEGEYLDNYRDGFGTYTWVNGDKYVGEWSMDNHDGFGTYTWETGDKYVGEWINGIKTGEGTYYYNNGIIYEGTFLNGLFNGQGKMKWPNGDLYIGEWKNDCRTGYGTYYFSDGEIYQGYFLNGDQHGYGQITFLDGSTLVGTWENGKYIETTSISPTGLIAYPISTSEININWDFMPNADYYYLYYSVNSNGPWSYFVDNNGNKRALNWQQNANASLYGCLPNEKVYFKVTAVTNGIESNASKIVSATTFEQPITTTTVVIPSSIETTIKSKITSDFDGFEYENFYELLNGQIWKQTSFTYEYHYAFWPEVLIYKAGLQYKMHVEGCRNDITVERIY